MLPVGALVTTDFVQYRLLEYLGDAFDLALMFDLVGRDIGEIVAVSAEYLIAPTTVLASATLCLGVAVWLVERRGLVGGALFSPTRHAGLRTAGVVFVAVAVGSTAVRVASEPLERNLRRKPSGRVMGTLVRTVTDVDGDGFGLLRQPPDPDPWNADVYPYAIDQPGNGIDENGVGGDHPASTPPQPRGTQGPPVFQRRPHVVLIVLESFRADLIGATRNQRPVTPVLNELARHGTSLGRAYSHNGYTSQSRFHLFSGTLVAPLARSTLVDDFKANGYEVAYFSGQDESFGGPTFAVGFDRADVAYDARMDRVNRYSTFSTAGSLAVPHTLVHDRVRAFLQARDDSKPLFLYLNFHDTHFPYHHDHIEPLLDTPVVERGDITPARAADLRAMYANTAANVDRTIGLVLQDVRESLATEPAIIVTSDHGESLFDEDFLGHGYALNDAQTRIPLIVVNLPTTLEEPFGQAQLRPAIWRALDATPAFPGPGADTKTPETTVFQYLGNLRRPRQIGTITGATRTLYDFRTGLARMGDADWRHPDELSPARTTRRRDAHPPVGNARPGRGPRDTEGHIMSRTPIPPTTVWLFRICLVALAGLVGLGTAEVGLRILGVSHPRVSRRHDFRGTAYRPHVEWVQSGEGFAHIRTNSAGFRDDEWTIDTPDDTVRIAVLGDSYVDALQVEEPDRFSEQLGVALAPCEANAGQAIQVMNFGQSGYGTAQELMTYRHDVSTYAPDLVILAFLPHNDLRNNSRRLQGIPDAPTSSSSTAS